MRFWNLRTLASSALALVLAACGGGGDGGIGGTGGGGGAGGNDISIGTITAFGSVWVNGVRFDSSNATIRIDDNPHPESDLRVGMIARVDGSIPNASAATISVESAVKGRVESVTGTTQMVVMGQTVLLDAATIFDNGIRPVVGDYVEIHGLVVSDGTVSASFVERKTTPADPPFVVHGIVKNHDTAARTFAIGALVVSVPVGATINDMPGGSWNGLQVEVKGSTCAGAPPVTPCGTLTASKVELDGPQGDVARIELEGFVTQLNANGFNLGTTPVVTTGATFVGGVASEVVVGSKVEVEGTLSGGIFTATKVSLRENVRFEANVFSKTATTFTLAGLDGITIETNSRTEFKGNVANLAALPLNSNVRVRGRPGSGSTVVATEVEFRDSNPRTDVRFRAIATEAADPNLTMLRQTISTSNIREFRDPGDNPITRAAFFNAIGSGGRLVEVRGTLSGPSVNWNQEAELED